MAWIIRRKALRLSRQRGREVYNYYVGYRDPETGKVRTVSAQSTDVLAAKVLRKQVGKTLEAGLMGERAPSALLEDFLAWKAARVREGTVRFYRGNLSKFISEWEPLPLHQWTSARFLNWLDGKISGRTADIKPWSPRTAQMFCTVVSQFCKWLQKRGVEIADITSDVERAELGRPAKKVIKILTWQQIEALVRQARFEKHALLLPIALASMAGLRRAEMQRLEWDGTASRVDLDRGCLLIDGKTGEREIPIYGPLRGFLEAVPEEDRTGLVLKELGADVRVEGLSYQSLRRLSERVGVPYLGWHGLRKSFCSALFARGSDAATIMDLMGHTDLKTTTKYAKAYEPNKRRAIDGLADLGAA